jgi:hypothetical protein
MSVQRGQRLRDRDLRPDLKSCAASSRRPYPSSRAPRGVPSAEIAPRKLKPLRRSASEILRSENQKQQHRKPGRVSGGCFERPLTMPGSKRAVAECAQWPNERRRSASFAARSSPKLPGCRSRRRSRSCLYCFPYLLPHRWADLSRALRPVFGDVLSHFVGADAGARASRYVRLKWLDRIRQDAATRHQH